MIALKSCNIYNTDTKTVTPITVTPGGTLNTLAPGMPKNFGLAFTFSASIKEAFFNISGGFQCTQGAPPFCCPNKNGGDPWNPNPGAYSINWQVMDPVGAIEPPQSFELTVIAGLPPTAKGIVGTNSEGISTSTGSPIIHPIIPQTMDALNLAVQRLWLEGPFTFSPANSPANTNYSIPLAYAKAGKRVVAVANFQNSVPRCSAPSDSAWLSYWNAFPATDKTGIWAICIGNETDTAGYYQGTVAQLGHLMQLAYPILKSKGYLVIAPSQLMSLDQLHSLPLQYCDAVDRHFYSGSAVSCLKIVDDLIGYAAYVGKQVICTEGGVRCPVTQLPAQVTELVQGLRERAGTFLTFPLYLLPGDNLDEGAPLTNALVPNTPIYNAFLAAK